LAQLPRQLPTAAVGMLSNELSQESNLLTVDRLPAIAPRFRFRHNRSMPEMKAERKPFVGVVSTYFSPHRRGFCFRVARRQQQLCLMRLEHPGRLFAARPPHESPLRQPFLRQPEPLAVIDQDTDRGPATARNTNRHPEKGSALSLSWHSLASESMPFLPSTGSIATRMRICGAIWITPIPIVPGSVRRDPALRPLST